MFTPSIGKSTTLPSGDTTRAVLRPAGYPAWKAQEAAQSARPRKKPAAREAPPPQSPYPWPRPSYCRRASRSRSGPTASRSASSSTKIHVWGTGAAAEGAVMRPAGHAVRHGAAPERVADERAVRRFSGLADERPGSRCPWWPCALRDRPRPANAMAPAPGVVKDNNGVS